MSVYIKKGLPFTASLYKLISLSLNKTTTAYPMVGSSNDGRDVMFFLSYLLFCCKYNYNIEFSKHLWC